MNLRPLFVMIFLLLGSWAHAQFKPGYIIPNESDTLKGYVRYIGVKIYYKPTKKDISDGFDLDDLEGFGILDRDFERHCVLAYVERFPEERCGFLEILEKGPVYLYRFDNVDVHGDNSLPNYYVKRPGGRMINVRRGAGFKKEMSQFFRDNPEIVEGIKSKSYNWNNIRQMIIDYNNPPE